MRATKLLTKLTIYYAVIAIVVFAAIQIWPASQNWLPIGGVEQLIAQPTKNPLQASEAVRAAHGAVSESHGEGRGAGPSGPASKKGPGSTDA